MEKEDLVILVADKQMQFCLRGLLSRRQALEICSIKAKIFQHPSRDTGCCHEAHTFLRPLQDQFQYALVLFDYDGCGRSEKDTVDAIQEAVENNLNHSGWENRSRCVVINPELEAWVWSESPKVDRCLGWNQNRVQVRTWLRKEGLWIKGEQKPRDPKKALDASLQKVKQPRSSALFEQLAKNVSVMRCQDPAFKRLCATLQQWFPNNT